MRPSPLSPETCTLNFEIQLCYPHLGLNPARSIELDTSAVLQGVESVARILVQLRFAAEAIAHNPKLYPSTGEEIENSGRASVPYLSDTRPRVLAKLRPTNSGDWHLDTHSQAGG